MLTFLSVAFSATAQNNPQRISDSLYSAYIKAYNLRKTPQAVPLADSLRHAAIAIGDRYGECYAMQILFLHEFYKPDNFSGVERTFKPYVEKVKAYGLATLYYYAVSMKVAYYSRQKRYIEAFIYLDEQTKQAEKNGDKEGLCSLYRMKGVIQHFRGELPQAIASYKQAIDMYEKTGYRRYISREYLSIADCYRMEGDFESLVEAAEEARPYCVIQDDRTNVAIYECYGYFMLGRYQEFLDRYEYIQTHRQKMDNSYVIMNKAVEACRAIYDSRNDDALRLIDDISAVSPEAGYNMYVAYYKFNGDYMRAVEYMRKLILAHCSLNEKTFRHDRDSRDRVFRDQRLEAERERIINSNMHLQLSNVEMSLHNSSLELGRSRDAARLAHMKAGRDSLSYSHQQLLTRQLRDSLSAQNLMQQVRDRRERTERLVQSVLLVAALLVMMMTFVYIASRRRFVAKLNVANAKLDEGIRNLNVAMDRALQSGRMKTLFIQNMSHELRTPLNAIVGFSQLLTSSGNELDDTEKKNMAKYIADNSELLTTLVNDILDMTDLQSGRYTVSLSSMRVNETCREAVAAARHRLADGVEMKIDTPLADSYTVVTDQHRLRQVLVNLLTNAEKNTPKGCIVLSCSLSEHPGMLTFAVADTGTGVPRDRQADIFERFKKSDLGKPGTGLGLYICRTIVSKLGGEINIDSEYTGGARFWLTIPIVQ